MRIIVPSSHFTFSPVSNTITLLSPFSAISEAEILRIRDETVNQVLYERNNKLYPVSVSNGIITYSYPNTYQSAGDDLQIELEFGFYAPRIAVWTNQAVGASATVNQSDKIYVRGAATIWLMATQTGASGVTFNIIPYESSTGVAGNPISVGTLSNSATPSPIIIEPGLPYISLQAINNDAVNAASINASILITWR